MALIGSLYASDSVHETYGLGRWVVIVTIYIFAVSYCMSKVSSSSSALFISNLPVSSLGSRSKDLRQRDPTRRHQSNGDESRTERKLRRLPYSPLHNFLTPSHPPSPTTTPTDAHQMTNFFVAFITPVLLAHSPFGIYFLFCGASTITVCVCAIFMPETRGQSLETVTESFHQHLAADAALIRIPRKLVSHIRSTVIRKNAGRSCQDSATGNDRAGLELRGMTVSR